MKQTIDESQFIEGFRSYNRMDNFSIKGLRALFAYLDDYEQSTDTQIEFDVIALCCDFSEIDISDIENETGKATLSDLRDSTMVIDVDDETIIYQVF